VIEVLTILAVARVTRLITTDVVFDAPRNAVLRFLVRRGGEDSKLAYLLACTWCSSVYVGAAGAITYGVWGETMPYMVVVLALSASYVSGWLASVTDRGE
jgi:hypothetical protein